MAQGLYSGVSGLALGSGLYRNVSGLWGGASGLTAGFGGGSPYGGASLYLDFLTMTAPTFDSRITFSRGTNATLTDSTGKLTYAPANLLTYSEQFDNAAWTKGLGGVASAPTVTANAGVAPDGTTTADRIQFSLNGGTAAGDISQIIQSPTYIVANYIFSVWLKSNTGGNQDILLVSANSQGSVETVTPTWQRFTRFVASAVAGASVAGIRSRGGFTSNTSDILAWGAQLEAVTYQTTPGTYVATTSTAYYGPRFDYDPVTLAAKGLLIEEARTNLLVQSNDFFTSWNTTNVTRTLNSTLSPDGTTNGVKLAATASAAAAVYGQAAVTSTSATYTVYVKQGTGATTANGFGLRNITTLTNLVFITINFSTGAITYVVGSTGATATNVGNGWWRVQLTATSGITSGDTCAVYVGWSGAAATAGDFLYAYGAQLEAGTFATSYIPTVASTVTRSADVATMTGTNFSSWFNAAEGTFVARGDSLVAVNTAVSAFAAVSDGTNFEYMGIFADNSAGRPQGTAFDGGVAQCDLSNPPFAITQNVPYAASFAYKVNDFGMSTNGSTVATDALGTLPTVNLMGIGNRHGNSRFLSGHIRQIAYFNTRLPDAQLQSITT